MKQMGVTGPGQLGIKKKKLEATLAFCDEVKKKAPDASRIDIITKAQRKITNRAYYEKTKE